jgi:hypothetical protein
MSYGTIELGKSPNTKNTSHHSKFTNQKSNTIEMSSYVGPHSHHPLRHSQDDAH